MKEPNSDFRILKADKVFGSTYRVFVEAGGRKFRRIWECGYMHVWMECGGETDAIPEEHAAQLESMLIAKLAEDGSSIEQFLNAPKQIPK